MSPDRPPSDDRAGIADGIVIFENGIRHYLDDVSDEQVERYRASGKIVHEPVEEEWFDFVLDRCVDLGVGTTDNPFVFVDAGSALGYYCLVVKRRLHHSRLFAIDASPHFNERMRATFKLNGYRDSDYSNIPRALYPHGKQVLFSNRDFESHIVQGANLSDNPTGNLLKVETIGLDDVLEEVGEPIHMMKVDIQSAELALFNRSTRFVDTGNVHFWVIGTHSASIHKTCLGHLERCHDILFEDPKPDGQPDGLIVAEFRKP